MVVNAPPSPCPDDRPARPAPVGRTSPDRAGPRPRKLGPGPVHTTAPPLKEHPVEIFFEALLVLVCVG
ncbi:hypothetical protein NGM37_16770, partial [Streptomyces sp. TRM76130]|nr:hypothetical protein [Streptomyces sp. TRM76130]